MTREIKFRAWNTEENEMVLFCLWTIYGYEWEVNGVILPDGYTSLNFKSGYSMYANWVNPILKIMQYTWLKDINWVEVYEGDIVVNKASVLNGNWDPTRWGYTNKKVVKYVIDGKRCWFNIWQSNTRVVIWNIYENPDLLNNNKDESK